MGFYAEEVERHAARPVFEIQRHLPGGIELLPRLHGGPVRLFRRLPQGARGAPDFGQDRLEQIRSGRHAREVILEHVRFHEQPRPVPSRPVSGGKPRLRCLFVKTRLWICRVVEHDVRRNFVTHPG